jgi:hypothetical protein
MKLLIFVGFLFLPAYTFGQTSSASLPPPIGEPGPSKGKAFNPDIGANFLGLFQRGTDLSDDRTVVPHNGFSLQEAEIQFSSDVDPYMRAVALLSVKQESGASEFGIDPEEIYLESISLPNVTVRAGKMKLALGKHNILHTHAYPFIDSPLIQQQLLGDEGLNEVGVSAAFLVPASWYSEITVQGFSPSNEELYDSSKSGDMGGLIRVKNLWDLTDDLTMEVGFSGTSGKNQFDRNGSVLGADLTFKWRPAVGGKYRALIWSTEYLSGRRPGLTDAASGEPAEKLGGVATWLQYQLAERWWVQGRYEYVGLPHDDPIPFQNKQSALVGFFPSEFSGLRLQYDHMTTQGKDDADHTFSFQYNVSMGAHPAHAY